MVREIRNRTPKSIYIKKEYAVCIPLLYVHNEYHILFEKRASTLKRQPNEICFPGGKVEKEDRSVRDAALRELKEELCIQDQNIHYCGELDYYEMNGFRLRVFLVELLDYQFTFNEEVGSVFTVPVSFLCKEPKIYYSDIVTKPHNDFPYELIPNHEKYEFSKNILDTPFYIYEDKVIWGLTARILYHNLIYIKEGIE